MKKIECVIMDWAGTAVDYGCFAPVAAFLKAFGEVGITVTMEEARRPMGMAKIDHIRELFKLPGVTEQFQKLYNRLWTEEDVVANISSLLFRNIPLLSPESLKPLAN